MTTARSTGAVSVISGTLVEAVPWRDDTGRLALVRHELQTGATLGFGAGHVHDVTNESDEHGPEPARLQPGADLHDVLRGRRATSWWCASVGWAADGCGESRARPPWSGQPAAGMAASR